MYSLFLATVLKYPADCLVYQRFIFFVIYTYSKDVNFSNSICTSTRGQNGTVHTKYTKPPSSNEISVWDTSMSNWSEQAEKYLEPVENAVPFLVVRAIIYINLQHVVLKINKFLKTFITPAVAGRQKSS